MYNVDNFDPSKPLVTEGYVCNARGEDLKLQAVTLPPLLATQVQVSITEVGLCHTDLHMRDNDWGTSDYPILLGHEGVGTVTHVGGGVRNLEPGDRVGIAWIRDGCMNCRRCHEGRENICESGYQGTYLGKSAGMWGKNPLNYNEMGGCYAKIQRIEERFALKIPNEMTNAQACPLLCGGGTMYEPLVNHAEGGVGTKVGIMGFGGLGRCGLKLAKLRGCYTVVISSSEEKRKAALESGADEFWCSQDNEDMKKKRCKLDVLVDSRPCVGETQDLSLVVEALTTNGVYCRTGIPPANNQGFHHSWIPAVFMQHSICGSVVTGSKRLQELLRLCASNAEFMQRGEDVFDVEVIPFHEVNEGLKKLSDRKNKGYRYVLKW